MLDSIFHTLGQFEYYIWSYVGFPVLLLVGVYFAVKTGFVHVRKFPHIVRNFLSLFGKNNECGTQGGVPPIKAFFACVSGSVGIGNIVGITTAVQVGGPGALFWIWCVAIIGSLIKYSEVFLGMRYRIKAPQGGYLGGPMYFLAQAFKSSWVVKFFCILMCLYGVEVYQFSVMTTSISENFDIHKPLVALFFLALVIVAELGGVRRVGAICQAIIPLFIILYLGMGLYVLVSLAPLIPGVVADIFYYAFTPHAAIGAFAGSTVLLSISQGIMRACYSSDVGVGYASMIHSESSQQNYAKQASLTIFEVFLDIFVICSMSIVLVLLTSTWTQHSTESALFLVQEALSGFFPYMKFFMPFFLFLLGYSTVITYFCAGMKAVEHLLPNTGRKIYYVYSVAALLFFSFMGIEQANIVMSIVLAFLLILNISAIWRLRHEIHFDFAEDVRHKEASSSYQEIVVTK